MRYCICPKVPEVTFITTVCAPLLSALPAALVVTVKTLVQVPALAVSPGPGAKSAVVAAEAIEGSINSAMSAESGIILVILEFRVKVLTLHYVCIKLQQKKSPLISG